MRWAGLVLAAASLAACPRAGRLAASSDLRGAAADSPFFELPAALHQKPDGLPEAPVFFEVPAPLVETLPNGLTLYLLEDRAVPLVHLRAIVQLGALDDPAAKAGLSAVLLSAMRAGGAGPLAPEALDDELERSAMLLGASLSDELSEISLDARSVDLERALALFMDVLRRPRFESRAVASVLGQAQDGVRRRADDPSDLAAQALRRVLWGKGSPFAREPSAESLSRIDRADLVALHARAVTPQSTRLLVTGDFDAELVRAAIARHTAAWPRGPKFARALPAPPAAAGSRRVILIARATAQAKVRIGQLGPARHSKDEEALELLDAMLGGAPGASRLYNEIRDRRGLAYGVESSISLGPVRGTVLVAADTRPEATRELLEQVFLVLEGVRGAVPVKRSELAVARDTFVNSFAFRFDTAAKAAYERALHDALGYPPDHLATERARILSIAPEAVLAAARAELRPEAMQIVVVGDPAKLGDLSAFGPVRVIDDLEELGE